MTIAAYDTHTLIEVLEKQTTLTPYWLGLCFPNQINFDTEYIDFDIVNKNGKRVAPFVSPLVQGKVMSHAGSTMKRFKPAYVKPKDVVDFSKVLTRRAGEAYTGSSTPGARHDAIVAQYMQEQKQAIENRWELMAAAAVINGSLTVSGDNYPTVSIDFGRTGNHTVTLGAGYRWNEAGVDPIADLKTYALRVLKNSGGAVTRVTMGVDAYSAFYANPKVKEQLDMTYRGTGADLSGVSGMVYGAEFQGRVGNLEIWTYSDTYENDSGTEVDVLDPKAIVLTSPAITGIRAFGAIMDKGAQFQPLAMFPKMWEENDPSVTYAMTQSAPLMIPKNPDGALKATVLA